MDQSVIPSAEAALSFETPDLERSSAIVVHRAPIVRMALERLLRDCGFSHVYSVATVEVARDAAVIVPLSLILLDWAALGSRHLDEIGDFKRTAPNAPLVVLTDKEGLRFASEWVARGADCVIDTRIAIEEVGAALGATRRGVDVGSIRSLGSAADWREPRQLALRAAGLRWREKEVLRLIARGKRNREITDELGLDLVKVKKDAERIYEKLAVPNRTAAAICARWLEENDLL